MLHIADVDHYNRVVRFARATGQLAHLTEILWYLHTYRESTPETPRAAPEPVSDSGDVPRSWLAHANGKRNTCELSRDFAPASFYFFMSFGLNGGVIYHGAQDGWHADPGAYTYPGSVLIGATENPWSVHT